MDTSKQLKNLLSLCTGYGGIERGLELAGVATRTLAYVEIEAFACANLVAKMETNQLAPAPIWTDLKTFPAQIFRDRVDVLTGGYPCQPFSYSGKRGGADDPRHLWPFIRDHIETIRPVWCFFENVEGHISLGLREVIEDLESLGYETTWGVFSAAEVGAPHQRKRVYILAHAKRDFIRQQSRWRSGENGQSTPFSGIDGEAKPLADAESGARRNVSKNKGPASPEIHTPDNTGCSRRGIDRPKHREISEDVLHANGSQQQRGGFSGGIQPEYSITDISGDTSRQHAATVWLPEPGLGRVVDGCADRVDRLRLLGNGVVPATAAKAWAVLNQQIVER